VSRVLIVTAVDVEARGLARHLGLARGRGPHGLRYRGATLDVVCAGPRALRLERLVDLASTASLIVSAGTCGALAPHLVEGDLVVPDTVLTLRGHRRVLPKPPGLSQAGALLDVDCVLETAEAKARLWQDTAAVAVDMESAAIAAWAEALGLPAIVIRGVSDTATHGIPAALADIVGSDGRTPMGHAMRAVLSQPRMLLRALALRRGTDAALRAVAAALRAVNVSSASVGVVTTERG
jgi:adenosylhomocysteine nucleosidase